MQTIGAIGLAMADVDLFPRPPRRSTHRSSRRQRSGGGRVARAFRHFIALAGEDQPGFLPRLTRYPY